MKELFRTNLYIADIDSVNINYTNLTYLKKFKSSLLMAKTIGMNPNMIFDSRGFETAITDANIRNFFVKKIKELQKINLNYYINVHVFNNFIEEGYFDVSTDNPFDRYYHEKIKDNYYFSSFGFCKKNMQTNSHRESIRQKFYRLNDFINFIYQETGTNIFKIHNSEFPDLREVIIKRLEKVIENNVEINEEAVQYNDLLKYFLNVINEDLSIKDRSSFYSILSEHEHIKRNFSEQLINEIRVDIIDISYNSLFIKEGEIFRFKSIDKLDAMYEKFFDSYARNGKMFKLYNLYKTFDNFKSKIELIDLFINPITILDYVADEIMNKAEDKGVSMLHKTASYILPKTRFLGVAESNNLLIGVKQ